MEKEYRQKGYNEKYPDRVVVWKYGEDVPEWLSDVAKISAIDASTNKPQLSIRNTNTGGYEIMDSSGQTTLVKTESREDFVCKSKNIIFSLTPKQFNLLYHDGL